MLAHELNFSGCQVLIVDTEGHDAAVFRSMISHCKNRSPEEWPWLIQFETMGNCDLVEGKGTEWGIINTLVEYGYALVHFSWNDTQLVLKRN